MLVINVVNRHQDKAITADMMNNSGSFTGKAEASLITTDDVQKPFRYDQQNSYVPVKKEITAKNGQLTYTLPPQSFTQIQVALK